MPRQSSGPKASAIDSTRSELGGVALAGHVDAGEAEAACDRDLHGRQLEEAGTALVGRLVVRLHQVQQRPAQADAGHLVAVEDAGHTRAQDVDGGQQRDAQVLLLAPAEELVPGAGVPADLGDGELARRRGP